MRQLLWVHLASASGLEHSMARALSLTGSIILNQWCSFPERFSGKWSQTHGRMCCWPCFYSIWSPAPSWMHQCYLEKGMKEWKRTWEITSIQIPVFQIKNRNIHICIHTDMCVCIYMNIEVICAYFLRKLWHRSIEKRKVKFVHNSTTHR